MWLSVVTPLWMDRPPAENRDVVLLADQLGYPEVWIGEMATYDAFAFAAAVGAECSQIAFTVGPLAVAVRSPVNLAIGTASVVDLSGRPAGLAIGTSSDLVVETWHGRTRAGSAAVLEESAAALKVLLAGDRGEQGFRLRLDAPDPRLTVAAFGRGAIDVAARHAERMVINMVTPAVATRLAGLLRAASAEVNRDAPPTATWLICAVDPTDAGIEQIRRGLVGYLGAPGYTEMFTEAGYDDLVELARSGAHPRDVLAAIPEGIEREVGLVGSRDEVLDRIGAYHVAGVDEICLVPVTAGDPAGRRTLEAMRPAADG